MTLPHFRILVIFGLWFLTALPQGYSATSLYRWIDENGNVFYSDRVPPKQSKYGRSELDEQGRTVNEIDAAKSKEQLDWEQKIEKLREQSKSLLETQLERDRLLLRIFRNAEEIRGNLAGKLSTVDVLINIHKSNIKQLQAQLDKQEQQAARIEKNGRKISNNLLVQISATKKQISDRNARIENKILEKQQITKKYDKDIKRVSELADQYKNGKTTVNLDWSQKDSEKKDSANEISVFRCYEKQTCDTAWQLALAYVQQNSAMGISISTDKIIYTHDPSSDQNISLSVSKISEKEANQKDLFLDIRCRRSPLGNELCWGERAQNILNGFKPYLTAQLRLGVAEK